MSFFNSELVQNEIKEIQDMQQLIYKDSIGYVAMNSEQRLKHIDAMEVLLEKQRILHTRMELDPDPQAKEMKDNIMDSAEMFGFPKNGDLSLMFGQMNKAIGEMKKQLDRS